MVFNTCLQLKLSPIWVVGDICSNMKGELRLCVWYWIWLCCELIFLVAYGVWAIFCCIRSFNRYFSSEYSIAASIFTIIAQNTSFSGLGKAGAGERLPVSVARLILTKRAVKCWVGTLGFRVRSVNLIWIVIPFEGRTCLAWRKNCPLEILNACRTAI